jgi:hypothetical protein
MSQIQDQERGDRDIRCQEIGSRPFIWPENVEAVRDCEDYDYGERVVGRVRLERSLEGESVKEAVDREGFAKTLGQVNMGVKFRSKYIPSR